jgi:hypothetical protein
MAICNIPQIMTNVAAFAACAAAGALIPAPAQALDYSYRVYKDTLVIDAAGVFEPDEADNFNAWFNHLPDSVRPVGVKMAFVFNSRGGSVAGAATVGLYIDQHHLNTGVAAGGRCASSCVLAWAAGAKKSATPDTSIGVHQASRTGINEQGRTYETAAPEGSRYIAEWLRRTGAPPSVIQEMLQTSPNDIAWLTLDELRQWNVNITY